MNSISQAEGDVSESNDGAVPYRCGLCSKAYKRLEHLQRHSSTHDSSRPHSCFLCGASFQRSDVLRRHVRSCNGSRFKPRVVTKKACDICSKGKRACDGAQPCSNCVRKSALCTYSQRRLDRSASLTETPAVTQVPNSGTQDIDESTSLLCDDSLFSYTSIDFNDWTNFINDQVMLDELTWPSGQAHVPVTESSLKFLESFTRNKGFVLSFDCGSDADRWLALRHCETAAAQANTPLTATAYAMPILDKHIFGGKSSHVDALLAKTKEIVEFIGEVVEIQPRNSAITLQWSQDVQKECEEFFSPYRLRMYLGLYWSVWHPNVNYMHRPTFDTKQAKASVVAPMAIIGASVSPRTSDNEAASRWLNCIEEVVFRDEEFSRDDDGDDSGCFPSVGRLQSIQAAYMVCLFQNWEGSDQSKRRIRRFRYSTLVAVVRDTGIHHARHGSTDGASLDRFSWSDFVMREQLIRTYLWVFLLDTAFVIFNNAPPRMAIKEMKMGFASNEAVFQAETSEACWQQLLMNPLQTDLLISSVTEKMCKGLLTSSQYPGLADLGPLNLFTLTSAIHSLIFQFQQSFLDPSSLTPIHNALQQWYEVWMVYSSRHANTPRHTPLGPNPLFDSHNVKTMWKRVGFSRFGIEYWLLAKMITARIASPPAHSDRAHLQTPSGSANDDGILTKYDETSMQQVNELISEFQKVIL